MKLPWQRNKPEKLPGAGFVPTDGPAVPGEPVVPPVGGPGFQPPSPQSTDGPDHASMVGNVVSPTNTSNPWTPDQMAQAKPVNFGVGSTDKPITGPFPMAQPEQPSAQVGLHHPPDSAAATDKQSAPVMAGPPEAPDQTAQMSGQMDPPPQKPTPINVTFQGSTGGLGVGGPSTTSLTPTDDIRQMPNEHIPKKPLGGSGLTDPSAHPSSGLPTTDSPNDLFGLAGNGGVKPNKD